MNTLKLVEIALRGACDKEDETSKDDAVLQLFEDCVRQNNLVDLNRAIGSLYDSEGINPLKSCALHILPRLAELVRQCNRDVVPLFTYLGKLGNPREVVLAVEERLEALPAESEGCDDAEVDQIGVELSLYLDLYAHVIPRLSLRRKTTAETLRALLLQVQVTLEATPMSLGAPSALAVLSSLVRMVTCTNEWVQSKDAESPVNRIESQSLLLDLLSSSLDSLWPHLADASLVRATFAEWFPEKTPPGWGNEASAAGVIRQVALQALSASATLGDTFEQRLEIVGAPEEGQNSLPALILLAHDDSVAVNLEHLKATLPGILFCLSHGLATEEGLAWLCRCIGGGSRTPGALSEEAIVRLVPPLTGLASTHPSPAIRQITFHLLSTILISLSASSVQRQLLLELVSECPFPQMRTAAVGIVKDVVLAALTDQKEPTILSLGFLDTFSTVLFRPNPVDLLSDPGTTCEAFLDSAEPGRLVEILGLYYVLLLRDEHNVTGIRDRIRTRENYGSLLKPLALSLKRWGDLVPGEAFEDRLRLYSLSSILEKVLDALSRIGLLE